MSEFVCGEEWRSPIPSHARAMAMGRGAALCRCGFFRKTWTENTPSGPVRVAEACQPRDTRWDDIGLPERESEMSPFRRVWIRELEGWRRESEEEERRR